MKELGNTKAELVREVAELRERCATLALTAQLCLDLKADIQEAQEYADSIVQTVREPLVVLSSDLKIIRANNSFYDTFKVTPEETVGYFIYDLGNRQWDIPQLRVLFEEILPHDTVLTGYEVEHDFLDIGKKIMLLNAREIFLAKTGSRIILLAMEDITERKSAEKRIGEIVRQQQAILDNIPNMAWLKDRWGRYLAGNQPFTEAIAMSPEELIGKSDSDIYPPKLAAKYLSDSREVVASGTRAYFEESSPGPRKSIQYLEKVETPIFDENNVVIGTIGIAHDVTTHKELEVALRYESTHDALTGLYNRAFFDAELERMAREEMFPMSVVMADVNGLKAVNDAAGHAAGDELIRMAARVIRHAFRTKDIVARIGGDEFAVILPETVTSVARETVRRIMKCPEVKDGEVSIAFGIATAEDSDQLEDALKLSDERMYREKSERKSSRNESLEDKEGGETP
ncbi:sensor domain-containing diguanylate cyclase [Geomonas ferrireducens]|uniref:sensor domain-containing diguanylate cyclase n=1 Tax=Geomonas ferrireducens TaxID=2570227 RepID=UPI0010A7A3F8|nr:diguanylate cyclase [Geomonas ferrireducens]